MTRRSHRMSPCIVTLALLAGNTTVSATLTATITPRLAGYTNASGVAASAGGSALVASNRRFSLEPIEQASYWNGVTTEPIIQLAPYARSVSVGISASGSVATGTAQDPSTSLTRAYRWSSAAGVTYLEPSNNATFSEATAISRDAAVIVGSSFGGGVAPLRATRWGTNGVPIALEPLPGRATSRARGVSGDGSLVVGISTASPINTATGWLSDGMAFDLTPPGASGSARGVVVAANGTVAITMSNGSSDPRQSAVYLWTQAGGFTLVPDMFLISDISDDGQILLGRARLPNEVDGMALAVWSAPHGAQPFYGVLRANGAPAEAFSFDPHAFAAGSTINDLIVVGSFGSNAGYITDMPIIPAPGSIVLLALPAALALRRRRVLA